MACFWTIWLLLIRRYHEFTGATNKKPFIVAPGLLLQIQAANGQLLSVCLDHDSLGETLLRDPGYGSHERLARAVRTSINSRLKGTVRLMVYERKRKG